jgi:hypothetical protein
MDGGGEWTVREVTVWGWFEGSVDVDALEGLGGCEGLVDMVVYCFVVLCRVRLYNNTVCTEREQTAFILTRQCIPDLLRPLEKVVWS